MKTHLAIQVYGNDEEDLQLALEEVTRLVSEGFTSGTDRNETGSFAFTITEEEEN